MDEMKPKDLAIAYSVRRKGKKKMMAQGGAVSAANESRPSPEAKSADSSMVIRNEGAKPMPQSMQSPRTQQASKPGTTRISRPRFTESGIIRPKLRDQEEDLMSAMPPAPIAEEPSQAYDEEDPMRMGSSPDMQNQHNNGRKAYFEGGEVSEEASEDDMAQHPAGLESDDDMMSPARDEYMAGHFADGGMADEDHPSSIAEAIMHKRKMMAEGGKVQDDKLATRDSLFTFPKEGVDIEDNAQEHANSYEDRNEAALKENYDSDMEDVSQPMDSNEHGHELSDEDAHDMISKIRAAMHSKRR